MTLADFAQTIEAFGSSVTSTSWTDDGGYNVTVRGTVWDFFHVDAGNEAAILEYRADMLRLKYEAAVENLDTDE